MPDIKNTPPPRGTYNFVLRRYDILPINHQKVHGYDETARSRKIAFQGKVAHTLFLKKKNTVDRCTKIGWIDETKAWFDELGDAEVSLSDEERSLLEALLPNADGLSKSEAIEAAALDPLDWRKVMGSLRDQHLIYTSGEGRNTRYHAAT